MRIAGMTFGSLLLVAPLAMAQVAPRPGVAQATVQLPVVNVTGVMTTVNVPDRGSALLGGISAHTETRGQTLGGVGPLDRSSSGTGVSVSAYIHDFATVDEMTSYRIAERYCAEGKIADSIDRFRLLASEARSPQIRDQAKSSLAQLRSEGLATYQAARDLYRSGGGQESADQMEQALADYGSLILTPERLAEQKQLGALPEVAQARHGDKAAAYLEKARQAQANGKPGVAKTYYRMAAKLQGTQAAASATQELAVLDSQPARRSVATTPAPVVGGSPQHLVDLARLYRGIDSTKSAEFYRQALLVLPPGSPLFAQVASEAKSALGRTGFGSSTQTLGASSSTSAIGGRSDNTLAREAAFVDE